MVKHGVLWLLHVNVTDRPDVLLFYRADQVSDLLSCVLMWTLCCMLCSRINCSDWVDWGQSFVLTLSLKQTPDFTPEPCKKNKKSQFTVKYTERRFWRWNLLDYLPHLNIISLVLLQLIFCFVYRYLN